METRVYNCQDIMTILDCSKSKAYEIINNLNKELESQGFKTIKGKVPKEYFFSKYNLGGD